MAMTHSPGKFIKTDPTQSIEPHDNIKVGHQQDNQRNGVVTSKTQKRKKKNNGSPSKSPANKMIANSIHAQVRNINQMQQ